MKPFRRKRRHRHTWSSWQVVPLTGVNTRTGVRFSTDCQQRRCTECGYTQREDL